MFTSNFQHKQLTSNKIGANMDGIIVINKPKEYTSHDVVAKVKKILNISKVRAYGYFRS